MALVFDRKDYDMVLELAENPNPQRELEKMTIGELLVLNDWIDVISEANAGNKRLQAKLLRLKTCATLTDESLRSEVGLGW